MFFNSIRKKYFERRFDKIKTRPGFCIRPYYFLSINQNGDYTPCCYMQRNDTMQNAMEVSPVKYYQSQSFLKFIKKFEKQQIDDELKNLCSRCFYSEKIHGTSPRIESNGKLNNPDKMKTIKENFVMKKMNRNYLLYESKLILNKIVH